MTQLTRKHLQQLRQHVQGHWNIANAAHVYNPDPLDEKRHRWYQCDKLHRMEPAQASEGWNANCFLPMAHPGDCMVRWQDAFWWCSPLGASCSGPHSPGEAEGHLPRLALIVMLGGPNDVKLIEEPDFGVIWDHILPKFYMPLGYDLKTQRSDYILYGGARGGGKSLRWA